MIIWLVALTTWGVI